MSNQLPNSCRLANPEQQLQHVDHAHTKKCIESANSMSSAGEAQVNPLWQRSGLGRGLVERLVAALVDDGVNAVTLFAEPNVVRMYEKLGFLQDPSKVQGLSFQRTSPAGAALVASCKA